MQAFQMLRSCTAASASTRALARTARTVGRRAAMGTRYYTDGKAEGAAEQASEKEGEKTLETPEAEVLHKLKQKEAEVTDLTGRLRYLQADFLNLQRNAAREKEQTRDFAITRFASDLLETVDVLSIALKSVPKSALASSAPAEDGTNGESSVVLPSTTAPKSTEAYLNELYTGVEMTHRLLLQTLFKYHVKPFDPTGDKFDPNRHEALYQAPLPDKEPGTVCDCQKIGYTIKDRILRAAQVGVVQDTQS